MNEIFLGKRKNGMAVLIGTILVILLSIAGTIYGGVTQNDFICILSIVVLCVSWLPFLGLKVLKPQEALVLTLFGKYIGTLKGDGFYYVNPFCVSVNPASKTKLNQSGDVSTSLK